LSRPGSHSGHKLHDHGRYEPIRAVTAHPLCQRKRHHAAKRVLYEVEVSIVELVDLTAPDALDAVGLTIDDICADDHSPCQRVGGAAAWLASGGLLVPSARTEDSNLVILVGTLGLDDDLVIVNREIIKHQGPE